MLAWQVSAPAQRKRAARAASFTRTSSARWRGPGRVRPIARTIPTGCALRANCASSFVRNAACRSPGLFLRPASRSRCTHSRRRLSLGPPGPPACGTGPPPFVSAGARRPGQRRRAPPARADNVPAVFWPLIGGFIAFVLLAVLLGWVLDPARHSNRAGQDPGHAAHDGGHAARDGGHAARDDH